MANKSESDTKRALLSLISAMDAHAAAKRKLADTRKEALDSYKAHQEELDAAISYARGADAASAQASLHDVLSALDALKSAKIEYAEKIRDIKAEVDELKGALDSTIKETRQLSLFDTAA